MKNHSSILDPVQGKLDQKIFRGTTPRANVIKFIRETIESRLDKVFGFKVSPLIHLYLTGSLTTYQYHDTSDVDINIFVDYDKWPRKIDPSRIRKDVIKAVLENINGVNVPNTKHPLQIFIMVQGVEPREAFDVGLRSAWDFDKKKWLVKPERDRTIDVLNDTTDIYMKAMRISEQMEILLQEDPEEAKKLYKKLHKKRVEDEEMFGDFSEGNIIYKFLDHAGQFDKLRDLDVRIANIIKEGTVEDVMEKAQQYLEEELSEPGSRFYNTEDPRIPIYFDGTYAKAISIGEEDLEKRQLPQFGIYETQIWMADGPYSEQLRHPETGSDRSWLCTCPWGQVSWDRIKKPEYEGRPCAHVFSLWWYTKMLPEPYFEEIEDMLTTEPPAEVRQILEQENQEDQGPFNEGDIVALKPFMSMPVDIPLPESQDEGDQNSSPQVQVIYGGTLARVLKFDQVSNKVYIQWDNPDDQRTWLRDGTIPPQWHPSSLFYKPTMKDELPQRRIKSQSSIVIKEALEVPFIF